MARLVDCWSLADDKLPLRSITRNQRSHNSSQAQYPEPTPSTATPTKKSLVPKPGTTTMSTRKIRRLGGSKLTANLLFQPWSAQDDDGSQARSQIAMKESPAKLGLVTEFEQDTIFPVRTKPSRLSRARLDSEACSSMPKKPTLLPLETEARRHRISSVPTTQNLDSEIIQTIAPAILFPSKQQKLHDQLQKIPLDKDCSDLHSFSGDAIDGESCVIRDGNGTLLDHGTSWPSVRSLHDTIVPSPTKLRRCNSLPVSTGRASDEIIAHNGALKPINNNIPSPIRSSEKYQDELLLSGNLSATKTDTSQKEAEDLLELFNQMHLRSRHEPDDGNAICLDQTSQSVTLPDMSTKILTSAREHFSTPQISHLPSLGSYWNQTLVNDLNDRQANLKLSSPSLSVGQEQVSAKKFSKKAFEAVKQSLARSFLTELDNKVANGRVSEMAKTTGGVKLNWTRNLNTTAGRANWRQETIRTRQPCGNVINEEHRHHHASIDLAEKVIDNENRLINVLAHEFCHLATFMISGIRTNPHGKEFKSWALKCSQIFNDRGIHVTTRHSYEIHFRYVWECNSCGSEYKRHSRSINTQRHRCGSCKGELKQIRPVPRGKAVNGDGASRPSEYQLFVKRQMKLTKRENPSIAQRHLMKIVAAKWAASKGNIDTASKAGTASISTGLDVPAKLMVDLTLGD
ncbi:hypothetical protein QQS21_001801 [Conoideocrella luteorostrata]|uniref:SprT-like domain-containing protein n=1 Tax=Conoideocrella luteorostrata TaxID=1105319 RepID=A0AAJ0G1N8_9HYPO|nr:hypothetical protein QQS21_001801 [Conoideocrella luteorostrata]